MSIIESAKKELELINFGKEDTKVMIEILEKFFDQWDSDGAVWAVAPILQRLIAGKPLSPLTGADDEWGEPFEGFYQNLRCSSVFKEKKDGEWVFSDLRHKGPITFPYYPEEAEVPSPVIEVEF